MSAAAVSIYNDLQGLAELRSRAGNNPQEATKEVASQFESLFIQMMLKSMRDATPEGGLFDSAQMESYQSMFDQQLSLDLASRGGGVGLASILEEQLGGVKPVVDTRPSQPLVDVSHVRDASRRQMLGLFVPPRLAAPAAAGPANGTPVIQSSAEPWKPTSPEEFIRSVWDYAVNAAGRLGLEPEVLVAQSALETGWGKRVIHGGDGESSFNLFGVKAGGEWSGKSAAVETVEFRDGIAVREKAHFRVYGSLQDSFDDYVNFLESNPRYQQALENVGDSQKFLQSLQDAGYATDPNYAEKIMNIVDRGSVEAVVSELKNLPDRPLSS